MVEPLEETRSELVFASEAVISSLDLAIPGSGRFASLVELDEVEVNPRRKPNVALLITLLDSEGCPSNM